MKKIVNKRKPWKKKNIHLKNNDNNNENDMCFCCNVGTNLNYDHKPKLTMHIMNKIRRP